MLNLNIDIEEIIESKAVTRVGTTASKILDTVDNSLDLINNAMESYILDQELELKVKRGDSYAAKKEEAILLEQEEQIATLVHRIERKRARREKRDENAK